MYEPLNKYFYRAPVCINNLNYPKSACQCHSDSPTSHNIFLIKYSVAQWAWLACQVTLSELGPGHGTPGWRHRHESWSNLEQAVNPTHWTTGGRASPKRDTGTEPIWGPRASLEDPIQRDASTISAGPKSQRGSKKNWGSFFKEWAPLCSFCSSYTGFFLVPWIHQTCFCLRVLALYPRSVWSVGLIPLPSLSLCSYIIFSMGLFPAYSAKGL